MTINNLSLFEVLNIIFYKIFKPKLHLKNEPYISINGKNLWEYGFDYREPWSGESDTRKCNLIWRKQNIEIKLVTRNRYCRING